MKRKIIKIEARFNAFDHRAIEKVEDHKTWCCYNILGFGLWIIREGF